MTEVRNTFAAKFGVLVVAAAMLFSMAVPAQADQSTEELQNMINQLLAQIDALQSQVGQGGNGAAAPAGVCPFTWTRNLGQGDRGADVMRLQQLLNSDPETRVAVTGPGSAGMETEFFGPATAAAVSTMQMKYRAEVLTPVGLVNPTGFFGPATRAKANALCAEPVVTPTPEEEEEMTEEEEEEETTTAPAPLRGGEATLGRFTLRDGEFAEVRAGQSDVPVAELEVEVVDGDASVNRLDLLFRKSGGETNAENRPWETFRSVAIWVDGDKVAEVDADRRNDWTRGVSAESQTWDRLRMTGLDIVLREDRRQDIVIAVTAQNTIRNVVGADVAEWDIAVPVNGFRMRDSLGIDSFNVDFQDGVMFIVEEAGADDELRVRTSSSDPAATTIEVDSDRRSAFTRIFAFELDSRDSDNEIEVLTMDVDLAISNSVGTGHAGRYQDIVNDVRLVVDGQTYRVDDVTGNTSTSQATLSFVFDDELFIGAGDRVTAHLEVRFNGQEGRFMNGTRIQASVDSNDITAEGVNTLDSGQLRGAATGEEHTLRSEGVMVELVSSTETSSASQGAANFGQFTMRFDITAVGEDVAINESAVFGESAAAWTQAEGILFDIRRGGSSVGSVGDVDATFRRVSGGTQVSSQSAYRIAEGSTATFELVVVYEPGSTSGLHEVQPLAVGFFPVEWSSTVGDAEAETLSPASDFRSGSVNISGN